MEKTRLKKVDRLIQKELSIIFQQNPLAEYRNILISVTVVRISPDLSVARVYLSIFPSDDSEKVVEKIVILPSDKWIEDLESEGYEIINTIVSATN